MASPKKVQVLDDIKNSDFTAARNEYHFRTPVLVDKITPMLRDQRDVPMVCLLLNIVMTMPVGMVLVYGINILYPEMSLWYRNLAGLVYIVSMIVFFTERFILCLHFSSHRSMFHNDFLNSLVPWVTCPIFGIPPGLYKLHHCIMHHIENNHEGDASSTEEFQRDSWVCFLQYWARFAVGIWYDLVYFTISTKRLSWATSALSGLFLWMGSIYFLATRVNFLATFWVFMMPHVVVMSAMAFGNWSQHIFVNPADRHSNYALTYNCLDTPGNQTTFNDGYHIVHHLNARLHWSEMPQYFHDNIEKMYKGGAICFRQIHFFDVGILVMTKQLRKLVEKHYVHIGPREEAPTVDEVEAKFREWLKPCPRNEEKSEKSKKSKTT